MFSTLCKQGQVINKQKTILLVEDEAIIAMAEAQTIGEFGYDVITVHSGEKAVELALSNESINLILMDINLGHGIDGPTAAEQILEKRSVPIIFLTSHTEQSYVDRVRKITRYGYVIKNSGNFVLRTSIEMAFELFNTTRKLEKSIDLLKINENLLNEAQQLAHIGHWHWNIIEKKLSWSEEIFAIFGVDRNSFVVSAENFEQLIHPDDRELFLKKRQFMLEHELQTEIEHRIVRPDNEIRYVVERAKVIRDKFGKVIYVIGIVQDITERKEAETKINELFTNIMKHAFTGRNTGLIQFELIKTDNKITLLVADNGNGLPADFDINESRGLGLMLIKMLAQQLRGSFRIESQNGTKSFLEFDI